MRYIYVILTVLILSSVCNAETSPNAPPATTLPASPNMPAVQQPTVVPTTTQPALTVMLSPDMNNAIRIAQSEMERDAYKQAVEAYKQSIENFKWAGGLVLTAIGFILVLFGYAAYKETKKYEEATAKAQKASEGARKCEQEAKSILDGISQQAAAALDKIKGEGKEQINEMLAEAEKEREVNELWKEGYRLSEENKYEEACNKFEQVIKLKTDFYRAYSMLCVTRAKWAVSKNNDNKLFKDAYDSYNKLKLLAIENNEEPVIQQNQTAVGVFLADSYIDAGKIGEAKTLLDEVEPFVKNNPDEEVRQELTKFIAKMRQKPGMQ